MIHIVNGDIVGKKLKRLNDPIIVWHEMYDFGPLKAQWSEQECITRRAAYFEETVGVPASLFIHTCREQNQQIDDLSRDEEISLWFEHDRYDQTMLIYLLTVLSEKGFSKLHMVSIDRYEGIKYFHGMSQLTSEQLIQLYNEDCKSISVEQIDEAKAAWKAYCSSNPLDLEKWVKQSSCNLPFLKQALQSHLSYFPSLKTGLNEVENLTLSMLKETSLSFVDLFSSLSKKRILDGLSDLHYAAILNGLMQRQNPLLTSNVPLPSFTSPDPAAVLTITQNGIDLLDSKLDRFECIGMDWWLGGVHLTEDRWRWDGIQLILS
ncbi:DUF1835 domain-containing protein [Bacillus sp. 03113]|uniref:DUF1835 domain-containing protein n=1 Tax=Bacillus sp. 03113 TaxID=2578211 RepID=UPI0015E8A5BB|nr:DUF1835 domain-containing protein [Bacillus sp. 03113]